MAGYMEFRRTLKLIITSTSTFGLVTVPDMGGSRHIFSKETTNLADGHKHKWNPPVSWHIIDYARVKYILLMIAGLYFISVCEV